MQDRNVTHFAGELGQRRFCQSFAVPSLSFRCPFAVGFAVVLLSFCCPFAVFFAVLSLSLHLSFLLSLPLPSGE